MNDLEAALKALPGAVAEMKALRELVDVNRGIVEVAALEVDAKPYLLWNAFITLLGALPYDRMTALQRSAHLAFFYDSDVQNGGHLQFFLNAADRSDRDVPAALDHLSLPKQAKLLRQASALWTSLPRSAPARAEEFAELARAEEFAKFDSAYHSLDPTISDALRALLAHRQAEFVRIKR